MVQTPLPKKRRRGGPRRKTGCYTCKSRHSRCDEKKPVCSNCERLNLECKQSDFIAPSEWNSATMDSTPEVPVRTDEPHSIVAENPASTWDIFKFRISGLDLISEESPPNDVLPHLNLVLPQIPTIPPEREPPVSLTPETAFLLQTYLRTVATWMDLMDHGSTYQLFIPRLTLTSPLLFHSVCAFAAKHLALTDSFQKSGWEPVASYHYGESLRLLIHALNTPSHEHALTATILLSSYEIIAALASEYHRRHLLGQAMLIKEHRITAQSAGIDRANFWIHVRHDISVALATERPLLLDPEDWNVRWQEGETREDLMGNHVLWILARVINLVYGEESRSPTGKRRREAFLRELEEYRLGVSDAFIGIPFGHEDDEGFRKHYFTVTAAASGAVWYSVTHILLYTEPVLQDESYRPHIQDHAMRIGNIAVSEFPDSLRVFATHGLYFAAKHINGIARKARIWNILNKVESQLGYHTRTMVKKLQELVEEGS